MNTGRDIDLAIVGRGQWHVGHVEHKVSDMSEELVLIDVPMRSVRYGTASKSVIGNVVGSTIARQICPTMSALHQNTGCKIKDSRSRDIRISVNHGNSLECVAPFDDRGIIGITNELGVVELDDRGANPIGARLEIQMLVSKEGCLCMDEKGR